MNLKAKVDIKRVGHFALAAGLVIAAACKQSPPPSSRGTPDTDVRLPMPDSARAPVNGAKGPDLDHTLDKRYSGNPAEKEEIRSTMSQLDAKLAAEDKLAEIRRQTMVTPAPADFKPETAARKVRLKLILEKSVIRKGELPRFRLEMTNVGREAIDYQEIRSSLFAKGGTLLNTLTMRMYVTDSRRRRKALLPPSTPRPGGRGRTRSSARITVPSGLPEADMKKWFMETNAMGQAHATFKVKLLPGETLHSIGDDDSPIENFKTLYTDDGFDSPGTYRLQLELDDRPAPLDKEYIEFSLKSGSTLEQIHKWHEDEIRAALGPVSSNIETFKVVQ